MKPMEEIACAIWMDQVPKRKPAGWAEEDAFVRRIFMREARAAIAALDGIEISARMEKAGYKGRTRAQIFRAMAAELLADGGPESWETFAWETNPS